MTAAAYASETLQAKGNLRYDILQSDEDPACFVIYEACQTKQDFLFHRNSALSLKWKEKTELWMEHPAKGYEGILSVTETIPEDTDCTSEHQI